MIIMRLKRGEGNSELSQNLLLDELLSFEDVAVDKDEAGHQEHTVAAIKNAPVSRNDTSEVLKIRKPSSLRSLVSPM